MTYYTEEAKKEDEKTYDQQRAKLLENIDKTASEVNYDTNIQSIREFIRIYNHLSSNDSHLGLNGLDTERQQNIAYLLEHPLDLHITLQFLEKSIENIYKTGLPENRDGKSFLPIESLNSDLLDVLIKVYQKVQISKKSISEHDVLIQRDYLHVEEDIQKIITLLVNNAEDNLQNKESLLAKLYTYTNNSININLLKGLPKEIIENLTVRLNKDAWSLIFGHFNDDIAEVFIYLINSKKITLNKELLTFFNYSINKFFQDIKFNKISIYVIKSTKSILEFMMECNKLGIKLEIYAPTRTVLETFFTNFLTSKEQDPESINDLTTILDNNEIKKFAEYFDLKDTLEKLNYEPKQVEAQS